MTYTRQNGTNGNARFYHDPTTTTANTTTDLDEDDDLILSLSLEDDGDGDEEDEASKRGGATDLASTMKWLNEKLFRFLFARPAMHKNLITKSGERSYTVFEQFPLPRSEAKVYFFVTRVTTRFGHEL